MAMEEDKELDRIKQERLRNYMRKASKTASAKKTEQQPDVNSVIYRYLDDRAAYVMKSAEYQFPNETKAVKLALYKMIKEGKLSYIIDGGTLLQLFRTLGLNVYVETEVKYVEHGKVKSLAEKLSENFEF